MMVKRMLSFVLLMLLAGSFSSADVIAKKTVPKPKPVHPIVPDRPIVQPGVRPILNTGIVYQDNHYTTVESCDVYKKQIDELNAYIDGLEAEISALKEKAYANMREELKKKNDAELQKFENRKSTVKTKNSIEIIDQ